jgi:CubicO group peptidase (beta-lactamase class C family)
MSYPLSFCHAPASSLTMLGASLMLAASATAASAPVPASAVTPDWLPPHTELDPLRASFDVPGVAIVGLSRCAPTAPINSGAARLAPEVAVTDGTVFEAASLSKPVFAYLVMKLVDAGIIDLDRPLASDFQHPRIVDQARYRLLTPRLILSHRAGLPNWVGDTDDLDRTDIIGFVAEPGAATSYSGEAYELLRAYVEFKTGERLDTLFKEHLGALMPRSGFVPPGRPAPHEAMGYDRASAPSTGRAIAYVGGSAGGLTTTVSDLASFVALVCSRSGLSKHAYDEMLKPQSPITNADLHGTGAYGLGWIVMHMGPTTLLMHDGSNGEFRSFAGFDLSTGDGVVVLSNGSNGGDLIASLLEEMQ